MMMTLMKLVNSATKFHHGMDKFYQPNSGLRGSKSRDEAVYTYVYVYIYICMYIYVYIYMYMYIYVYVNIYTCIYIYIYIYICMYIYMYVYVYVCMYMCVCICIYGLYIYMTARQGFCGYIYIERECNNVFFQ